MEEGKVRITIELEKPEEKERLLKLLKEQFGKGLKVVETTNRLYFYDINVGKVKPADVNVS